MNKVYISGGLTNISDPEKTKKFYEDIDDLCKNLGFKPYTPHLHSDPVAHPNITPEEVYDMDYEQVAKADIIIAYIGEPSLGVGIELEIAKTLNKTIIVHYKDDQRITRMARGFPGTKAQIVYRDLEDGLDKIRETLLGL